MVLPSGVVVPLEWVAPGSFTMGSMADERGRGRDEAAHVVRISEGFWMSLYFLPYCDWSSDRIRGSPSRRCRSRIMKQ
jgi:hypothetical protein